jgi:IrrE N-terminal-like domain
VKGTGNRYLRRICSEAGETITSAAIGAFVRAKCSETDSLETLARKLGVNRITEDALPFEGGLFDLPSGERIIKLNADSSRVRKRFTLAHEIGHLLLGKPGLRSSCGHDRELERACDLIASELLMPLDQIKAFVLNLGSPSPENLKSIASKYSVSVHAAAIRVHADLGVWKCFVGLWERTPEIRTVWFVGRRRWDWNEPNPYSLDLALGATSSVKCSESWQRGPFADRVWLNLLRTEGRRVLGLIDFVN